MLVNSSRANIAQIIVAWSETRSIGANGVHRNMDRQLSDIHRPERPQRRIPILEGGSSPHKQAISGCSESPSQEYAPNSVEPARGLVFYWPSTTAANLFFCLCVAHLSPAPRTRKLPPNSSIGRNPPSSQLATAILREIASLLRLPLICRHQKTPLRGGGPLSGTTTAKLLAWSKYGVAAAHHQSFHFHQFQSPHAPGLPA